MKSRGLDFWFVCCDLYLRYSIRSPSITPIFGGRSCTYRLQKGMEISTKKIQSTLAAVGDAASGITDSGSLLRDLDILHVNN
jgi:hypothetical protein